MWEVWGQVFGDTWWVSCVSGSTTRLHRSITGTPGTCWILWQRVDSNWRFSHHDTKSGQRKTRSSLQLNLVGANICKLRCDERVTLIAIVLKATDDLVWIMPLFDNSIKIFDNQIFTWLSWRCVNFLFVLTLNYFVFSLLQKFTTCIWSVDTHFILSWVCVKSNLVNVIAYRFANNERLFSYSLISGWKK